MKLSKTYDSVVGDVVKNTTVFVHGIAGDTSSFKGLLEFLEDVPELRMRLVAFDLLGTGESPSEPELDFGYTGQLEALKNSLEEIEGPVVLVGHSMGTLIATRFAALHPEKVREMVLISPPIYTTENLSSTEFKTAMTSFQEKAKRENIEKINLEKAFDEEVEQIVMDTDNYRYLTEVGHKTTLIYGEDDQIIASFNIPAVLKANKLITAVRTPGSHGVSPRKYEAILEALRKVE